MKALVWGLATGLVLALFLGGYSNYARILERMPLSKAPSSPVLSSPRFGPIPPVASVMTPPPIPLIPLGHLNVIGHCASYRRVRARARGPSQASPFSRRRVSRPPGGFNSKGVNASRTPDESSDLGRKVLQRFFYGGFGGFCYAIIDGRPHGRPSRGQEFVNELVNDAHC